MRMLIVAMLIGCGGSADSGFHDPDVGYPLAAGQYAGSLSKTGTACGVTADCHDAIDVCADIGGGGMCLMPVPAAGCPEMTRASAGHCLYACRGGSECAQWGLSAWHCDAGVCVP